MRAGAICSTGRMAASRHQQATLDRPAYPGAKRGQVKARAVVQSLTPGARIVEIGAVPIQQVEVGGGGAQVRVHRIACEEQADSTNTHVSNAHAAQAAARGGGS
jgi:hypothetical protein